MKTRAAEINDRRAVSKRIPARAYYDGANRIWLDSSPNTDALTTMFVGDSQTTGSNVAPGGPRTAFLQRAREAGLPVTLTGPALANRAGYPTPYEPMCAGYAGETIEQLTARMQSGGSIYSHVQTYGAPKIGVLWAGTNNASAGATAAAMRVAHHAMVTAWRRLCPNAFTVLVPIPSFYSPASPTGGLSAANAVIAQFNTELEADATAYGHAFTFADAADGLTRADVTSADGVHLNFGGQAHVGSRVFDAVARVFSSGHALRMPRSFRMRTKQASATLATKTTDTIQFTGDDGWKLDASNFLMGGRFKFSSFVSGGVTAILQSTPSNYLSGFLWAYDNDTNPKTLNFYPRNGTAITAQTPITTGQEYWLFAHGDRANGVVSFWMGQRSSYTAVGAPWVVACVGVTTGVTAWAAGDAAAVTDIGKNASFSGFAGQVDNVFMAKGASVPGFASIRDAIEGIVFEGNAPPGCSAYVNIDEGTGTSIASRIGGATGTLTGAWSAAGSVVWPSDE